MTLPVSYKEYVYEKYLLCIMGGLLSWVFSTVFCLTANIIRDIPMQLGEELMNALLLIPVYAIIASIFIPFQLKFGGEKSRIAMVGLCGITFAIFFLVGKVMEENNININMDISGFVDKLNSMPYVVILLIIVAAAAVVMAASISCSLAIMKKKEY